MHKNYELNHHFNQSFEKAFAPGVKAYHQLSGIVTAIEGLTQDEFKQLFLILENDKEKLSHYKLMVD